MFGQVLCIGRYACMAAGMTVAALFGTVSLSEKAYANGDVIQISSTKNTSIKIAKGKPKTIRTNAPFYEIVIGDPAVANVNPLTDKSFYGLGNSLGTTGIALFDENKQLVGTVDVEVTLDTDRLASTIRNSVPDANIEVSSANGRLVLSGSAKDAVAADKATRIASRFSGEEEVINSVNISSSQQVQLNVQQPTGRRGIGYANQGSLYRAIRHDLIQFVPRASSNAPAGALIGSLLNNGLSTDVAIEALEKRGVARRLAEPNLIARSGETASFLAGGRISDPGGAGQ